MRSIVLATLILIAWNLRAEDARAIEADMTVSTAQAEYPI